MYGRFASIKMGSKGLDWEAVSPRRSHVGDMATKRQQARAARSKTLTFSKGHGVPALPPNLCSASVLCACGSSSVLVTGVASFESTIGTADSQPMTFNDRLHWFWK
jgi:hypothetical protein